MLAWTGPREGDVTPSGRLIRPVPPERWPYGPPDHHEACCHLHRRGLFCDCLASDGDDVNFGQAP